MPRSSSRVARFESISSFSRGQGSGEVDQLDVTVSEEETVRVKTRGASVAGSTRRRQPKVEAQSPVKEGHRGAPTGKKRRIVINEPEKSNIYANTAKGLMFFGVLLIAINLSIAILATPDREKRNTNGRTSSSQSTDEKEPPTAAKWWSGWKRGSPPTTLAQQKQGDANRPTYLKAVRHEAPTYQRPEYYVCPPCPAYADRHVRYVCPSCKKVNSDSPGLLKDPVSVLSGPRVSQLPALLGLLQGILNAEHQLLVHHPWIFLLVTGLASILPLVFASRILSNGVKRLIELWKMSREESSVLVQSEPEIEGEREKSRREAEQELLATMKMIKNVENVENVPQVGKSPE